MAFSLLNTVKSYFSDDLINKAAEHLGENPSVVSKGLDAVIPISLAGIVQKAESGNAESLLMLAKQAFGSGILDNLAGTFSEHGGGVPSISPGLISGIFGGKFGGIANMVSSVTGLKGSSSSSLIGSVLPLALGLLGKYAKDNHSTPGSITEFLGSQKNDILSTIPPDINLSKLIGASEPVRQAFSSAPEPAPSGNKMLYIILTTVAGLAILLWLAKGCNEKHETMAVAGHDTVVTVKADIQVVKKESIKVTLPNGVILDAYKGGIEDLLVAFLNDSSAAAGKDNWFDFNELNFTFGTAEIVPGSFKEVTNIKEILKAYPKVKIKMGGYTDKVGDDAANKKLSQQRADAVAAMLKEMGVGSQITGAEGYGSEFAKYPADAPEADRIKDRRISVSVREK
jgi:outer membrane protein OmpA-like peptidoglycan-associated protein